MNYRISITGSGTENEIIKSLSNILREMKDGDHRPFVEVGLEWEDPTLMWTMQILEEEEDNN